MSESKKLIGILVFGAAILFLLSTNIFLPIAKENDTLFSEYAQLKGQVKSIGIYSLEELLALEKKLKETEEEIEMRFLPKEQLQLTKQLTQVAGPVEIAFSNISYKKIAFSAGGWYQVVPVALEAKAKFYDMMSYLEAIENKDILICFESMHVRNVSLGAPSLEIEIVLNGFRMTPQLPPAAKFLEERYTPFDKNRAQKILTPLEPKRKQDVVLALGDFDPYYSAYDFEKLQALNQEPEEEKEVVPVSQAVEDLNIGELTLKGITGQGDKKVALINESFVQEGDSIAGAKVFEIHDYHVLLNYKGKQYILTIGANDEFIK